jgi:hypothetical protein
MEHAVVAESKFKQSAAGEPAHPELRGNPCWELAQRVVAGPHFARSPLLSKFLLFVVAETLDGRGDEITEHQIGVQVFDRPANYRTVEDNIVRTYARQLRKRLVEHFAERASSETIRIDIPVGAYVPVFLPIEKESRREGSAESTSHEHNVIAPVLVEMPAPPKATAVRTRLNALLLMAAYSAALVAVTWYAATRAAAPHPAPEPARALWRTLFDGAANSYIVPSDAGFNLLEDISQRPLQLADYIAGDYEKLPLVGVDPHSAEDLRTQQLAPFVDMQIATSLAHLAEDDPQKVLVRFPRDLRLDDLKNSNAVIIGSLGSNPWASLAEASANFRIFYQAGMNGAQIINKSPQPGEAPSYASHWNEPSHETYALIEFLPNLSGNGHLLVLEGLDVAGTQATAEMLLRSSAIDPILKRAERADGSLRNFEVLLRSTSIQSSATGTQVIASRIY